jgi:alpha-N-arabinofuranosidase
MKLRLFLSSLVLISVVTVSAQKAGEISVLANKPVTDVPSTMWGVFFEDINFAADGGIYAELVKNRSFEFSLPMMGWKQIQLEGNGRIMPTFYSPANPANPRFLQIVVDAPSGSFGIVNEGFRGIKKDGTYNFSVSARVSANASLKMKLELLSSTGTVIANSEISGFTSDWKKYKAELKATLTDPKAQFRILWTGNGTIDIDMVSLFPSETWKNRPGGLRNDLVQLI